MMEMTTRKTRATEELLRLCSVPARTEDFAEQIRIGANVDVVDQDGKTPLHLLVGGKYGSPLKIKALIDANADKNAFDGEGKTPLIRAIINESLERVEDLLDFGFDASVADREGKTPHQYVLQPECLPRLRQLIFDRLGI
jgi:ankyrin repeat protein